MSKFPLYDSLSKDIKNRELTVAQKKDFVKKVSQLDQNGHELLYAVIRMYQVENKENNTCFALPYNGLFLDSDIKFDLENFPKKLKQILFKFIKIHLGKMTEEENIEKQTPVKRV